MDKFTKEKRSAIMRAIRGRDTQPELIVIWECGLTTLKERERTFRKVEKWLKGFADR